ncbi:MAG: hypothetical protein RLY70_3117 [Planctomycetota bacterium]
MPGDPEPRAVCTRHGRSSRTPDCLADTRNRGGRLAVHRDYRRAKATSKPANRSVPQWRPAPNPPHHLPPHRLPPSRRRRPGQSSRSDPKWPITPQSRCIDYRKSFAAGLFTAEPKATAGPTQPIRPEVANYASVAPHRLPQVVCRRVVYRRAEGDGRANPADQTRRGQSRFQPPQRMRCQNRATKNRCQLRIGASH